MTVPARQQYSLTRNGVTYSPVTADLNDGGWEVRLGDALGDPRRGGRKAQGVYVIRDKVTGRIYKVGKTKTDGLVARLEAYAQDFVTHGYPLGIRITAEVYHLPTGTFDAERVLRGAVNADGWDLSPASGAADGSFDEELPPGTAGRRR